MALLSNSYSNKLLVSKTFESFYHYIIILSHELYIEISYVYPFKWHFLAILIQTSFLQAKTFESVYHYPIILRHEIYVKIS